MSTSNVNSGDRRDVVMVLMSMAMIKGLLWKIYNSKEQSRSGHFGQKSGEF